MTDAWRRALSIAIGVVGVLTVGALVVVPLLGVRDAERTLERLDADIVTGAVRSLAPAGDIGSGPDQLFTVRRVPELLVEPVRERRAFASVADIAVDYPEPACLAIRVDGLAVRSAGTEDPLIPASVQKLLTAAAVLETIGPNERLTTLVLATGPIVDGEIDGDLVLVGGGDPMLAQRVYADAYSRQPQLLTPMSQLAARVAATGVRRVSGRILVNDDRYDDVRVVETWPERYLSQFNAGPIGALTVNDGFAEWEPTRVYADDPAIYAGDVLGAELLRAGVRVDGGTRRAAIPDEADPLASIESPPIAEIVQQMLRESDNNTAESLLKELGFRRDGLGTTTGGAAVVRTAIAELGLDADDLVIRDGSGLDRGNLVTCALLAELLDHYGPESVIGAGLAVAGESGTIGHRFEGTPVEGRLRAKTGLLNNVNGLAGWIEGPDGTVVTFAQLLNGIPLNSRLGFELQEQLALDLADVSLSLSPDEVELVPVGGGDNSADQ